MQEPQPWDPGAPYCLFRYFACLTRPVSDTVLASFAATLVQLRLAGRAHSGTGGVPPPTTTRAPKRPLELVSDDCRRVCTPDYERPFSSLYNAVDRLLPFHVGTPSSAASAAIIRSPW